VQFVPDGRGKRFYSRDERRRPESGEQDVPDQACDYPAITAELSPSVTDRHPHPRQPEVVAAVAVQPLPVAGL
jgi:hypothetical protein